MQYRTKIKAIALCTALFFVGNLFAMNFANEQINQENKEKDERSLFSLIGGFFDSLTILYLIEKINLEDQKKIEILCNGCQKKTLACAELVGHLCAATDQKSLNELKNALMRQDVQAINQLMTSIANEQQIVCIVCKKFTQWS